MTLIFLDIDGVLLPYDSEICGSCSSCGATEDEGGVFVQLLEHSQMSSPCCLGCAQRAWLTSGRNLDGIHYRTTHTCTFCEPCLTALEKVIAATGAVVCLSGTWRMSHGARERILSQFQEYGGEVTHLSVRNDKLSSCCITLCMILI